MSLFSLEQSAVGERLDFAFYGAVALALAGVLWWAGVEDAWAHAGLVLLGLASWSVLEYGLHRFVLHGLPPFSHWHAAHHARPRALIGTPTPYSAALFAALVFLPCGLLFGWLPASALLLGVLCGYLLYAGTHRLVHGGPLKQPWLRHRQQRHAVHHGSTQPSCYGVTTGLWDHVFRTHHRHQSRRLSPEFRRYASVPTKPAPATTTAATVQPLGGTGPLRNNEVLTPHESSP